MSVIVQSSKVLYDDVDTKEIDTNSGVTAQNLVKNYETISVWLDKHSANWACPKSALERGRGEDVISERSGGLQGLQAVKMKLTSVDPASEFLEMNESIYIMIA